MLGSAAYAFADSYQTQGTVNPAVPAYETQSTGSCAQALDNKGKPIPGQCGGECNSVNGKVPSCIDCGMVQKRCVFKGGFGGGTCVIEERTINSGCGCLTRASIAAKCKQPDDIKCYDSKNAQDPAKDFCAPKISLGVTTGCKGDKTNLCTTKELTCGNQKIQCPAPVPVPEPTLVIGDGF